MSGSTVSFDVSNDAFPARGGVGDDRRAATVATRRDRYQRSGPAPYVELHAHSAYSFLDGASLPEELAARAAELGYDALALTDHDGVYGSLEFAHAAKHLGVRSITGAEVTLGGRRARHAALRDAAGLREPLPHPHRRARGHARAGQGARPAAGRDDDRRRSPSMPKGSSRSRAARGTGSASSTRTAAARLARAFRGAFYVELQRPYERGDARRNARLEELAERLRRADGRDRRRPRASSRAVRGCRTCSSRSSTARRSTAASANGAATTSRAARAAGDARAAAARRGAAARARSPTGARST